MKNKKIVSWLAIGGLLTGAVASIGLAVHAQSTSAQPTVAPIIHQQTSSINNVQNKDLEVADQKEVSNKPEQQNEQAEQASLRTKATITADQAKKIAKTKVVGTATSATLEDENGTAVYAVKIGNQEVKVNAANGSITKIEKSDAGNQGKDQEINNNGSSKNNDGETNDGGIDFVN